MSIGFSVERDVERDLVKSFTNDPIQVDHPMSRNGIQILGRIKDSPLNPVTQAGHNATGIISTII